MPTGIYPRTDSQREAARRVMQRNRRQPWNDPSCRRRMRRALLRRWQDEKYARKMREVLARGRRTAWKNPEYRKNLAKCAGRAAKKLWKDPNFVKKILSSHVKPSKPQISLFKSLCRLGARGIRLEYNVARFSLDIARPEVKRCVEVDGPYWHDKKRDRRRDKILASLGWKVLRIPIPLPSGAVAKAELFMFGESGEEKGNGPRMD